MVGGLVNQVAPFLAVAPVMDPFRELLKKTGGKAVSGQQLEALFHLPPKHFGRLRPRDSFLIVAPQESSLLQSQGIGFSLSSPRTASFPGEVAAMLPWGVGKLCSVGRTTVGREEYSTLEGSACPRPVPKEGRLFLLGCNNPRSSQTQGPFKGFSETRN
ncbi:hypothetical protein GWK47_011958 [Chionoecetes opilio]|uniref:Uncharacterized protein n=1 Tax=Chionoecetes opilio TaxID=41210 RepID=A0A8J5CMA0_CHIOP|nr:hypothetical protein GWK47_011958 [Chionoecetes opilio]